MEHAAKITLRRGSVILQEEFQDIIDQLSSNPLFRRYYESKNPPPGGPRTQRSHSVADISSFTPTLQQHIQQSIHMLQTRHNPHNPPLNNSSNPPMKRPREEEEEQYPYKRTDNGPTSSSNNNINSNNNNNNNSETEYVRRRGSMSWESPSEPSSYPSKPPSYPPPHQSHSNSSLHTSSRPSHPHSSPHLHSEPHYSQSPYPSDPSYSPSEPYYPHHHSYYPYPPHYPPSHHPQGSYHHPPYSHTPPPYAYPHPPPSPGDLHPNNNTYDADHPSPSSPLTNGPTQHKPPPYRPPYPSKPYSPHSATPPTPVNGGGYSTPSPGQYYTPPPSLLPPSYKSNPSSYNSPNRGAKSANGVSSESDHYPSESYSPAPLPSPSLPPPYSSSLPYDEPSNPQTKPDLNASSDSLVDPFPFPLSPSDPSSHPFLHNPSDSHYRNRLSRSSAQISGHHPHPPAPLSRSSNQLSNSQSKRVGPSDSPSNSHLNPPSFKADHSNSHPPSHSSEKTPFDEPFDLVSSYSEAPPVNFYPTDHTRSSVGDIEDRGREEEARHDNGKGKDEKREDERPSAPLSLSAGSSDSFGLSSSTNSMILSLINEGLSDPDSQSDPPPDSDSTHPLSHSFTDLPNNNPAENSSDSSFSLETFTDPYFLYATKVISQRLSKLPPPSFPIPTTKNHPSDNSHFSAPPPHHPPHYPPPFHPHNNNNNGNNNNNNNNNNNYSRRHSISHIPLNGEITNEDLKVTKWTNVTTTIAKKYAKGGDLSDPNKSNEPHSSAPSSTPGDVKLLMSKWKCTKYRVD